MRIKDLSTRVAALLSGSAWFGVDNGSKVEKVAYSEIVKQGIENYTGTSLAGSNQSVKSAVDALNSKLTVENKNVTYTNNVDTSSSDNYTYIKKYGSLVNINFQVKLNSSISGVTIITLPSDLYPLVTSRGFSFIVSTNSQKYCGVSSANGVYVSALSEWAGKLILGSITYLIN